MFVCYLQRRVSKLGVGIDSNNGGMIATRNIAARVKRKVFMGDSDDSGKGSDLARVGSCHSCSGGFGGFAAMWVNPNAFGRFIPTLAELALSTSQTARIC